MTRWEDVLDTQQHLWGWWQSEQGRDYGRTFGEDVLLKHGAERQWGDDKVQQIQETTLFHAEPIAIDPDMWTLVEYAQKEFQPEPLRDTDLVTEAGFVVLPKPMMSKDIWGKAVSYRAIAWMPALRARPVPQSPALEVASALMGWGTEEYGIWLSLYYQFGDPDEYDGDDLKRGAKDAVMKLGFPSLQLAHQMEWRYGADYTQAKPENMAGMYPNSVYTEAGVDWDKAIEGYVETLRSVQALLRLLNQHIAVRVKHRPDRATRRRAERAEYPPKDVTVVHLRRPRSEDHPLDRAGKQVEWSHRWIVAGHWRNQPYPSIGETRQIWISPYVKGPEDKELRVREKRVFVLSR